MRLSDWPPLVMNGGDELTSQRDIEPTRAAQAPAVKAKQAAEVEVKRSAVPTVARDEHVLADRATAPTRVSAPDDWFVWLLALGYAAVPAVVLVCVASIPKDELAWHAVYVSIGRGDFLIPAMALSIETIRRLWQNMRSPGWKTARLLATVVCSATALVCIIAMTTAASMPVTVQTGSSLAVITSSSLAVGVVLGTVAVSASRREANK